MSKKILRPLAVCLTLAWAAFWLYFVIAATLSEPGTLLQKTGICLVGSVVLLLSALVPLRNSRAGGGLLMAEGAFLCVANFVLLHNPPATKLFLLFTMALPPLVAGTLFLLPRPHPRPLSG